MIHTFCFCTCDTISYVQVCTMTCVTVCNSNDNISKHHEGLQLTEKHNTGNSTSKYTVCFLNCSKSEINEHLQ